MRDVISGMCLFAVTTGVIAATPTDFSRLTLEELMAIEITSVAKKTQRLSDAAAAIHVLTHDDIRRSGATSVAEVLRLVPGVQVARIDGNKWSISIRGFSNRFSDKLLVMIDGRTVYTPLFSGVYWEAQHVPLEEVDRIEVIRGPGGTLWGANAVNGVINIITRPARDSEGKFVQAYAGNLETGGTARVGGKLGDKGHYRVYAMSQDQDAFDTTQGAKANDAAAHRQGGFRIDYQSDAKDAYTLQGDFYNGEADQKVGVSSLSPVGTTFDPDTVDLTGANVLFRWRRVLSAEEDWQLQAYYDRYRHRDLSLRQRISTFDIEFQHRFQLTSKQELTWGLGYRNTVDELEGGFTISFTTDRRDDDLFSTFIQDQIRLQDDLHLTIGSKFEDNDYTGFEYQPSVRLLWQATDTDTVWGAVSRAVRTPSRADHDSTLNYLVVPGTPFPVLFQYQGSRSFESEELLATELGYRKQWGPDLTLDVSAFYNDYDNLRTTESNPVTPPPPYVLRSGQYQNNMEGTAHGVEITANWQVMPDWRLKANYSWLQLDMKLKTGSTDTTRVNRIEGSSPEHMLNLQSLHDLSDKLELGIFVYYMDELEYYKISDYTRLDMRLAWRPQKDMELSLTMQNLQDERHPEFQADDVVASEVPRSFYGQIRWQF